LHVIFDQRNNNLQGIRNEDFLVSVDIVR